MFLIATAFVAGGALALIGGFSCHDPADAFVMGSVVAPMVGLVTHSIMDEILSNPKAAKAAGIVVGGGALSYIAYKLKERKALRQYREEREAKLSRRRNQQ